MWRLYSLKITKQGESRDNKESSVPPWKNCMQEHGGVMLHATTLVMILWLKHTFSILAHIFRYTLHHLYISTCFLGNVYTTLRN